MSNNLYDARWRPAFKGLAYIQLVANKDLILDTAMAMTAIGDSPMNGITWAVAYYEGETYKGWVPGTRDANKTLVDIWAQRYNMAFCYNNGSFRPYKLYPNYLRTPAQAELGHSIEDIAYKSEG